MVLQMKNFILDVKEKINEVVIGSRIVYKTIVKQSPPDYHTTLVFCVCFCCRCFSSSTIEVVTPSKLLKIWRGKHSGRSSNGCSSNSDDCK